MDAHAQEALQAADISATEESLPHLLGVMARVAQAAYLEVDLAELGASGAISRLTKPLAAACAVLPAPAEPPAPNLPLQPVLLTFREMWTAWKGVTASKPRTVDATRGMLNMLAAFLSHDDAGRVTRDDLRRWRDHLKADRLSSNTWNNRLSLIGQVFKWAVADERLAADPTVALGHGRLVARCAREHRGKKRDDRDAA